MSLEPLIEQGFAGVQAGTWLVRCGQPAVSVGAYAMKGLKGFVVPDRRLLQVVQSKGMMWLSVAQRPFLTHLTSTGQLTVVTSKMLVAPVVARGKGRLFRPIPMSFRYAFPVTELKSEWGVMATASRVK